ncbi:MAG: dihydroorotase [Verrucomicrobiae bacterium]|nr:dihydroorotase [Verrucomicrobiae bacterium]
MALLIKNGHVIDPANGIDGVRDLFVWNRRMADPLKWQSGAYDPVVDGKVETIDAAGKIVCPGLIDLHVHLREPGQSAKETIETGTRAAAAGGFTSVVCMPNTSPAADSPSVIALINQKAEEKACINVFTTGAITRGIAGEELAPIGSLKKAGVVALTDDGHCVQNNELMRRAVEYARMFDLPVMDHCQDYNLVGNGVMNEGQWSVRWGLPGWPALGEEIIVARNILISEKTDHYIHCQHLSCAGSVRLIREARKRGVKISGEVCPHHILLTDELVGGFDTNFKMNPPLRTRADIEELLAGIADGTITVLASDHAPHCAFEKEVEFDQAPFGILGLETELSLFLKALVHSKVISLKRMIEMFTVEPARLLKLKKGSLEEGADADITIIDPGLPWTVDRNQSLSKSRNTPFHGWELTGRAVMTIVSGKVVWRL